MIPSARCLYKKLPASFVAILCLLSVASVPVRAQATVSVIVLFSPRGTDIDRASLLASVGAVATNRFDFIHAMKVSVPSSNIEQLSRSKLVAAIDPDNIPVHALDSGADHQIGADQVWTQGYTGNPVRIAILDTGIELAHPEFSGRILACHSEVAYTQSCQDDDIVNGQVVFHGTHVAGLAAAQGVNPNAEGVAPSAYLLIDKVLNSTGGAATWDPIINGINWAIQNNARIINLSLGGLTPHDTASNCDTDTPALTAAVNQAVNAGITVVAASGNNDPSGDVVAPACISTTIAVGAVDSSDTLGTFSDTGAAMVDHGVVAPGVSLLSTTQLSYQGGYRTDSGTSMATPIVSGTIALMLNKNPTLSPAQIKATLFSVSYCSGSTPICPNTAYGHGRVYAPNAINGGFTMVTAPTSESFYCGYTQCDPPQYPSLTLTSVAGFSGTVLLQYWYQPPNGGTSLSGPSSVLVPSGGSASVSLTASPGSNPPRGYFQWYVKSANAYFSASAPELITIVRCTRPPCPGVPTP